MLKSGGGWYYLRDAAGLVEGWNRVVLDREDGVFTEGAPAGWDKVDGLRLNVFAAGKGSAVVTVAEARGSAVKVAVPPPPLFTAPKADRQLRRANRRDPEGRLLETRVIADETEQFLIQPDVVLDRIARAGFNAFMPCVWNGGWAMYRSSTTAVEPGFAPRFAGGRDPLAEFIAKARARGIAVVAWFKVSYRARPDPHPEFAREGTPEGAHEVHDPAFRGFVAKEIGEFARRYAVDGAILDYVRTQGASSSDIAREAYRRQFGADLDETKPPASAQAQRRFLEFQRDAVSDLVRRVREGLRAARPKAILAVFGHPLPKPTLDPEGRNEWLWLERGYVDLAYAMEYDWQPDFPRFSEARASSPRPRQHALMLGNYEIGKQGQAEPRRAEQVARLLDYALRKFPENGVGLYWYPSLDDAQVEALRRGPFKEKAVPHWELQ